MSPRIAHSISNFLDLTIHSTMNRQMKTNLSKRFKSIPVTASPSNNDTKRTVENDDSKDDSTRTLSHPTLEDLQVQHLCLVKQNSSLWYLLPTVSYLMARPTGRWCYHTTVRSSIDCHQSGSRADHCLQSSMQTAKANTRQWSESGLNAWIFTTLTTLCGSRVPTRLL